MKKVVSIHQPSYFSWFGLFDKIIKSDIFIILDDVQFNKRAFQHRTLYSNASGKAAYLTLPVDAKNHQKDSILINQVILKDSIELELQKHFNILKQRYGKFKGFKKIENKLKIIFDKKYVKLIDLVVATMNLLIEEFGISTEIVFSSDLNVTGTKSELMLNLTKAVNGDIYLSGRGAEDYMNDDLFKNNNVEVIYQDFEHIRFNQELKKDFQVGCLALEIIFLDDEFKKKLHEHYLSINQIDLIKGLKWIN